MTSPDESPASSEKSDAEIVSSLESIVESADKWLGRLRARDFRVRLASSFLTTILVFVIFGASALIILSAQGKLTGPIGPPPRQFFPLIGLSGLVALAIGTIVYFFLTKKHEGELKELASLVATMKEKNVNQEDFTVTDRALELADKITAILPDLVRKRRQDSLLFGVVAFILTLVIVHFPPSSESRLGSFHMFVSPSLRLKCVSAFVIDTVELLVLVP
jgi:hypothetical protein